ncbi:sulfotransferase family protein [Croceimicrobium hydrocarbonivorans]|uniref:Sulfotransferase n=1 Tax=Croceimicrobium hydrocarbonivorans TaxID=2761580 RepID=A0A7H0VCU7_9FLAO|nr:sulfotransferase [Croceimicrobium hydrocarbonivorans]QNR23545.1 sulfotransferase [Croceimicrobium hydrocarbonivorans]
MDQKALLPDFVVIGAGKSGTTSLHEYLNQHPKIFMGDKEPNFFAYELLDPETLTDPTDKEHYFNSVYKLEDYLALFKEAKPDQLKGEVSNTYISNKDAWQRIKHYVPEAKLMAILRHPADRIFSRYFHLVRENEIPEGGDLNEVFNKESIWWRRPDLVNEGFYYRQLKPYFEHFDADQIKVFLYEDFIGKTDEVVKEAFQFLGVDPNVKVGTDVVYNKSGKVRNKSVDAIVGQESAPIRFLKKFAPGLHRQLKGSVTVNRWLNNVRNKNLEKPDFDPKLKQRIINEIYREDIENLQKLIKRDLKHWL